MTNSNDNNRLDRIEAIVESNSRNIDILLGIVSGHQERILTVFEEIRDLRSETRDIQSEIRDIQSEIRGLQTENRRILDRLFGQQGDGES